MSVSIDTLLLQRGFSVTHCGALSLLRKVLHGAGLWGGQQVRGASLLTSRWSRLRTRKQVTHKPEQMVSINKAGNYQGLGASNRLQRPDSFGIKVQLYTAHESSVCALSLSKPNGKCTGAPLNMRFCEGKGLAGPGSPAPQCVFKKQPSNSHADHHHAAPDTFIP